MTDAFHLQDDSNNGPSGCIRTIVWDVDDVLNDLTRSWFHCAWRVEHPETRLSFEDLTDNPPHRLLGVPREQYLRSLDTFRRSEKGRDLSPVAETLAWFHRHGAQYRHIALTATPRLNAEYSAAWVMRHFGDWIRTFCFVPSYRPSQSLPAYDRDKGAFLRWWQKAYVLVDDNEANIEQARQAGMRAVLFPQPWNASRMKVAEALDSL